MDVQDKNSTQYSNVSDIGNVNYRITIPTEKYTPLVCHYIPAQFPVPAYLDRKILDSCRRDWEAILADEAVLKHFGVVFYQKLSAKSPRFDEVFPPDVNGKSFKVKLLKKALTFSVNLQIESAISALEKLGRFHQPLAIRPWMFSDYFICIIETLSEEMGDKATYKVMEMWYQLLGFVALHLIEGAIEDNVLDGEVGVGGYSGPFQGDSRIDIKMVATGDSTLNSKSGGTKRKDLPEDDAEIIE